MPLRVDMPLQETTNRRWVGRTHAVGEPEIIVNRRYHGMYEMVARKEPELVGVTQRVDLFAVGSSASYSGRLKELNGHVWGERGGGRLSILPESLFRWVDRDRWAST